MSIALSELKKIAYFEKVIIHSIDLALYQVSVVVDGIEHYVIDKKGWPIKAHNKIELQSLFEKYNVGATYLRAVSAYDEMIGQPIRAEDNTLEVLLGKPPSGLPAINQNEH